MIITIILALLLVKASLCVYNVGVLTAQKVRLQMTTDAAAYSAALWQARFMNYCSYTRRAVIANYANMALITAAESNSKLVKKFHEEDYPIIGAAGVADNFSKDCYLLHWSSGIIDTAYDIILPSSGGVFSMQSEKYNTKGFSFDMACSFLDKSFELIKSSIGAGVKNIPEGFTNLYSLRGARETADHLNFMISQSQKLTYLYVSDPRNVAREIINQTNSIDNNLSTVKISIPEGYSNWFENNRSNKGLLNDQNYLTIEKFPVEDTNENPLNYIEDRYDTFTRGKSTTTYFAARPFQSHGLTDSLILTVLGVILGAFKQCDICDPSDVGYAINFHGVSSYTQIGNQTIEAKDVYNQQEYGNQVSDQIIDEIGDLENEARDDIENKKEKLEEEIERLKNEIQDSENEIARLRELYYSEEDPEKKEEYHDLLQDEINKKKDLENQLRNKENEWKDTAENHGQDFLNQINDIASGKHAPALYLKYIYIPLELLGSPIGICLPLCVSVILPDLGNPAEGSEYSLKYPDKVELYEIRHDLLYEQYEPSVYMSLSIPREEIKKIMFGNIGIPLADQVTDLYAVSRAKIVFQPPYDEAKYKFYKPSVYYPYWDAKLSPFWGSEYGKSNHIIRENSESLIKNILWEQGVHPEEGYYSDINY